MTKEEIVKNNISIGTFMGIEPVYQSPDRYSWTDLPFFSCRYSTPEKVMKSFGGYAKYDSSWDWLMSVVEKIESLWNNGFNVHIGPFECIIRRQRTSANSELCSEVDVVYYTPAEYSIETKIEAVYNAVIEFIKWYNNQQEK